MSLVSGRLCLNIRRISLVTPLYRSVGLSVMFIDVHICDDSLYILKVLVLNYSFSSVPPSPTHCRKWCMVTIWFDVIKYLPSKTCNPVTACCIY